MTDTGTTNQFADLTADETVAHLRDHPEDAPAIRSSEESRDKPRKTVLDALDSAEATDGAVYDPVGDYPERPLAEALHPDVKAEMLADGRAIEDEDGFRVV